MSNLTSVDLAYELAVKSYEVLERRWDAMNLRLQKLLALLLPLVLAFPVALKALNVDMEANLIWGIEGSLFLSIILCLIGCAHGHIEQVNLFVLHEQYLTESGLELKKGVIKSAGESMLENVKTIKRKWQFYLCAIIPFCISAGLILWSFGLGSLCAG